MSVFSNPNLNGFIKNRIGCPLSVPGSQLQGLLLFRIPPVNSPFIDVLTGRTFVTTIAQLLLTKPNAYAETTFSLFKRFHMKHFSCFLLACLLSGSIFAQSNLTTDAVGNWRSGQISCGKVPLTPVEISGLSFPNIPDFPCAGTSATGNLKLGEGGCGHEDHYARVFRNTHVFATKPCLVTYNLTADNALRIYVNGISSPTNILPGASGVCGNEFSTNDWYTSFPGTLDIDDFALGNNNIDFETQNGTDPGAHPFWLSGNMLFWEFSDLNSSLYNNFNYDPIQGILYLAYASTAQTNGALFHLVVERSDAFPSNQAWTTVYMKTGSKKDLKLNPCPPITKILCDEDGAAVRLTLTAMAGTCQTSTTYLWSCNNGFRPEVEEYSSTSDNPDFRITSEQIKDLHDEFNEKMMVDRDMRFSADSLFAVSTELDELQVFPNPSNGHIWIKTTASQQDLTLVKIFNQLGRQVFEGQIQSRQEVDLSGLPNGIYYLKTFGDTPTDVKASQFILQR